MVSFTLDPFIQKNGLRLVGLTEQLIGKFSVIFCAGFEICGNIMANVLTISICGDTLMYLKHIFCVWCKFKS